MITDIRAHLWVKAWGNLALNPISALTGATLAQSCRFPATRALAAEMMAEAAAVADKLGISMRTVEVHRAHIFDKMQVKTAVELAGLLKW